MDSLCLIGIGTGNPDHLTRAGLAAIQSAHTILIPRKGAGKADLADLRREICEQVLGEDADERIVLFDLPVRDASGDYHAGVEAWHDAIATAWTSALAGRDAGNVALLVWGDPSLYDSTLRIADRLTPKPTIKVIPGITALQALTAAHAIPLNDINTPVTIKINKAGIRRRKGRCWAALIADLAPPTAPTLLGREISAGLGCDINQVGGTVPLHISKHQTAIG